MFWLQVYFTMIYNMTTILIYHKSAQKETKTKAWQRLKVKRVGWLVNFQLNWFEPLETFPASCITAQEMFKVHLNDQNHDVCIHI